MATQPMAEVKTHLAPVVPMETPFTIVRAEGPYLWTEDGRRVIDMVQGIAVHVLGHSHPRVVEAVRRQAQAYLHVYFGTGYQPAVLGLVERLLSVAPPGLDMVWLGNSGAEAVEAALKLSRLVTGRPAVIAFQGAFHGRTLGAVSLTASASRYRSPYEPLVPSVYHLPYAYCPGCPMNGNPEGCSRENGGDLEALLRELVEPEAVAAVVVEPVLGEGGYYPPPPRFLRMLREVTARHGILLVFDEVQSGMGRTGRWWAGEHAGVVPDLMTLGKALGGGLPLSALVGRADLMRRWPPGTHGSTFGGNPVAAAAGSTVLDVMVEEDLVGRADRLGSAFTRALAQDLDGLPGIREVRGVGFMVAVEFASWGGRAAGDLTAAVLKRCLEDGLLLHPAGVEHQVVRFIPPLNVAPEVLDEVRSIFVRSVRAVLEAG